MKIIEYIPLEEKEVHVYLQNEINKEKGMIREIKFSEYYKIIMGKYLTYDAKINWDMIKII